MIFKPIKRWTIEVLFLYLNTAIELCNKNSGTLYTSCNASMLHKQTALLLS